MAGDVTGVLLVGGASRRFGSPKALAQLGGETLAERAHRTLSEAFGPPLVLGKTADELDLPFAVEDDGLDVRAPIAGVVAALRRAPTDVVVVLPTDVPNMTAAFLDRLAAAVDGVDAAVPGTGPLPGAYRRSALPVLEGRMAAGELALRGALAQLETRVIPGDADELANVNTREDLARLER